MLPLAKPKLGKLATPLTSTFPSEVHSASTITPRSAMSFLPKPDANFVNTPITPPLAYTDFLSRAVSLNSPALPSQESSSQATPSTPAPALTVSASVSADAIASASAIGHSSDLSDTSSDCSSSPTSSTSSSKTCSPLSIVVAPPSPTTVPLPMSAPPTGPNCFPSLKLPPSPAFSYLDSPMSARLLSSPFSARSMHSPFDWELALKTRLAEQQKKSKSPRTGVRHIREVVTRTVTYTPKIDAAPRGKRRKVE